MANTITCLPLVDIYSLPPTPDTALISIYDADETSNPRIPVDGWGYYNSISFDFGVYDELTIEEYGETFPTYFQGCPTKIHALKLLVMFKEIDSNDQIKRVIIHCDNTCSRSGSVAKYYAESRGAELEFNKTSHTNSLISSLLENPNRFDAYIKRYIEGEKDKEDDSESGGFENVDPSRKGLLKVYDSIKHVISNIFISS